MKNFLTIFSLLLVTLPSLALADTVSWQATGTSDWNTPGNWSPATPNSTDTALIDNTGTAILSSGASGAADTLLLGFDASGALVISSGGLATVSNSIVLGFNSLSSGSLSLSGTLAAGGITTGAGSGTVTVDGGVIKALASGTAFLAASTVINPGGLTVDSNGFDIANTASLSGTGALTKTGTGSLTLTGSNTYAGGTVLNEGTLRLGDFDLDVLGSGTLTINGGTVGNAESDGSNAILNDLSITNDMSFDIKGADLGLLQFFGNLDLNGATRTMTLTSDGEVCFGGIVENGGITFVTTTTSSKAMLCGSDNNTFGGPVRVETGVTLTLDKDPGLIAINGDLTVDQGASVIEEISDQFSGTGNLVLNGIFDVQDSGTNTFNAFSGTGQIISDTFGVGPSVIAVNSGTFGGTIDDGSGQMVVRKQGSGLLVLSGSNSYTGGTTVVSGTLRAANNRALGQGNVDVSGGGVVHVDSGIVLNIGAGNKITLQNDGTSAYAKEYSAGEDLAHFNDLTSSGTNGTVAQILSGTASAPLTLTASFANGPAGIAASDTLKLTGSGSDTFVLQLSYNEALAISLFGSEDQAFLGYLDNGTWVNAVDGNTGGTPNFILGAWNSSYTLGTYGVDTTNNTAWAVLNHNSDFAVIPEPSTWLLLGFGVGLVLVFRKRVAV